MRYTRFIKKLILGKVSIKNMGGLISIAQMAGDTATAGLSAYLFFLAALSVNLAALNLLPIPVLDGGHLCFYLIEVIKGKPLPEPVQLVAYQVGLFIVVGVMFIANFNDVMRLFF